VRVVGGEGRGVETMEGSSGGVTQVKKGGIALKGTHELMDSTDMIAVVCICTCFE
jgi:hypothetical protein